MPLLVDSPPVPPHLSLVCPVYDEAENIAKTLEQVGRISIPLELLIVYDRDEDTTVPVARRLAPTCAFSVRLVRNAYGRGVPQAIRTGFDHAEADAVLVVMADLSDDFSIIERMYELSKQGYDVVCGSRYMPGGRQIGGPRLKAFLSRSAGLSLHWLTGLPTRDATNSFKMYRRDFLREVSVESAAGFEIGIEMLVKAWVGRKRIIEIPSTWTDRVAGQSRFRLLKWLPKYLRWYFFAFKRIRA